MTTVYDGDQSPLSPSKVCNRCEQRKALSDFSTNPSSKDGRKSICKVCDYATTKARRAANPEQHKARSQASYRKNSEHKRAYVRANRERINAYWRNRYASDPEYHIQSRQYYSLYTSTHREQANAAARRWREKNPLKNTEYAMSYKARKQGVTTEDVDYQQILKQSDGLCYICEKPIEPHHEIEFDHVIPITRNGIHAASNIKVTHSVCNSRKNAKLLSEMTPFQRRGPAS